MPRRTKLGPEHFEEGKNQSDIAKAAGVSRQAVSKSRMLRRSSGSVDVEASKKAGETLQDAALRTAKATADSKEYAAAQQAKLLVEVAAELQAWAGVAQVVKEQFLNLPLRISGQLAAAREERVVRELLSKEIRSILGNIPENIRELRLNRAN